ncbi:MAG TPA: hypothetical protein VLR52_06255, partial [Bacteroidales bacterium]|nr:hypothetical protein [Bacteroidales bacterium]
MTPALYYLLPMFRRGLTIDPGVPDSIFDPGAWQSSITASIAEFIRLKGLPSPDIEAEAAQIFQNLLLMAKTHGDMIHNFTLDQAGLDATRWMAVVGVDSKTRVKLNIILNDGRVDFSIESGDRDNQWDNEDPMMRRLTGDGTVPYEGAVPAFLKEENLICVTPDDYGYWEIQDKALSAIAGFHGILPNMNMLHRLIVRFLKNLDDNRGSTWGRSAPGVVNWEPPLTLTRK